MAALKLNNSGEIGQPYGYVPYHEMTAWSIVQGGGAPEVLAGVVGGVNAAQNQLASRARGVVAVEPEGEDRLRDEPLVHHILEGRRHTPNADLREGQPLQPQCNWA